MSLKIASYESISLQFVSLHIVSSLEMRQSKINNVYIPKYNIKKYTLQYFT